MDLISGSTIGWTLKFAKGHNSVKKNLGRVMVLILSTLSDNALYLYQVLSKYLRVTELGFQSCGPESKVDARVVANVDGRMYKPTYRWTYYRTENGITISCHA